MSAISLTLVLPFKRSKIHPHVACGIESGFFILFSAFSCNSTFSCSEMKLWEMADSTMDSAWAQFRMPASKSFCSSFRRVVFDTVMLSVEILMLTPEWKKEARG